MNLKNPMKPMKAEFIELCIKAEVLRFGEFKLKSGRISPYFFNAGLFNRGGLLGDAAQHYARLIIEKVDDDFMLFGPAYKGIPLAAATALKLADDHNRNVGYAFNRKESKDHGEGGQLVGATLRGNVVIIDDVITAGTSIGQSVAAIKAAGATPHSVVIALDREEVADQDTDENGSEDTDENSGKKKLTAVQYVQKEYDIPVHAIINLQDLIDYLEAKKSVDSFNAVASAIQTYREQYGIA